MRWDAHKAAESSVAESLKQYVDAGVFAAAKALGRSTRNINRIAAEHGVQFRTCTAAEMANRRAARDLIADQVAQLAGRQTQAEICAALNVTRATLREVAEIHNIDIDSRSKRA
jgi:hypothetical protein